MERRASQENPVDLIDSGQFLAAEEMFSERRTDDPKEMVVRSEVAIYFDRLDDGASLLEQVAPRIGDIDVAARFSLAKGNLALRRNDFDQAETQLNTAYHFFLFQNDSFGLSRSLLGLARLARLKGAAPDAFNQARRGPGWSQRASQQEGRIPSRADHLRAGRRGARPGRDRPGHRTLFRSGEAVKRNRARQPLRLRAGGTGRPQMRDRRVPGFA